MQYLLTFLEGVISFISPCLLPMLPVYISYFAGEGGGEGNRRVWPRALAFVLGFTVVFVALGLFAGALGSLLRKYQTVFQIVCGLIDLTLEELKGFSDVFEEDVYENVSLEACVSKRTLPGGPARESVLAHIHSLEKFLSGLDAE